MFKKETKRSRIVTIDILRGLFLVIILIDHLNLPTYIFEVISGNGSLFASAAEGFFLISGLLVGYLFVEKMKFHPGATTKRLLKRAFVLYGWSIGLTVLFTLLGYFLTPLGGVKAMIWPEGFSDGSFMSFIWQVLTLQYVYGWADFLAHYVVFMALAPIVVWLTAKGKGWLAVLGSLAVWWFGHDQAFNYAWQLLFMSAIVAGYYLPTIEAWWKKLSNQIQRKTFITLTTLTVSSIVFGSLVYVIAPLAVKSGTSLGMFAPFVEWLTAFGQYYGKYIDKDTLEYGRIFFAALWFVTAYLFVRTYEQKIITRTKNFFNTIGSRSLYVYGFQAFVVFVVHIIVQGSQNIFLNSLIVLGSMYLIYLAAKHYELVTRLPFIIKESFNKRKGTLKREETSY